MNRDAILNKAHELAKKAELINGKIPKSTLIAVAIDMAEFGYHQAEKELALTWQDIQKVFHLVNSVLDDPWVDGKTKQELFEEVLRRFKKETGGEQEPVIVIPKFRIGDTIRLKGSLAEYTITSIYDGCYHGKGWCLDIIEGDKSDDYELVEQTWSEEDKAVLDALINKFKGEDIVISNSLALKVLTYLRHQKQWKPSEEQMRVLALSFHGIYKDEDYEILKGLFEQLKALYLIT